MNNPNESNESNELLKAKILSETARISWLELQRFFAQGKVIKVSDALDLIDVAYALAQNDQAQITDYMNQNHIEYVNDDDAKHWFENNTTLWASVVKPWVLVQEKNPTKNQ
ncbi:MULTISPECIES: DUF2288 domain-containing protein [Cysteiniphilum]|uniref:DUF2288 domain-containing protein n=1 Tax=Cysteiniphilum TaxID=2056696 RepID=UPI0017843F05|nr:MULTISPECIES: DUF2288 domain-containing protein [Cysteiniphilum]